MSDTLAHYSFIPWLRQGVASEIDERDTLGVGSGATIERASITVDVVIQDTEVEDSSHNDHTVSKEVKLYGPGDIIGVSDRAIVRTEPPVNVFNFEANLLAFIEFYEEDFPWRYTPARPSESGSNMRKLRPWLSLVVLKEDEFSLNINPNGLSNIVIAADKIDAALSDHKEIWAWAHVHMNNPLDGATPEALATEITADLANSPDNGISRIICPRKLQKSTAYTAFLVPSFETGRLAGLGEATQGIAAQEPAWRKTGNRITTGNTQQNTFPIYYHWKFGTGALGDFETLVSILTPIIMQPESGSLKMDIQDPGYNMKELATSKTVGFECALKPPEFAPKLAPSGAGGSVLQNAIKKVINLSTDMVDQTISPANLNSPFYSAPLVEDPVITPPIYGYWHALVKRTGDGNHVPWVDQLNHDPRFRAAAGLGTEIIQKRQEKLMNRAWQQVGDIKEANQKIKESRMAKMVASCIFKKHLANSTSSKFMALTSMTHSRVADPGRTQSINNVFKKSKVPLAAKSAAFRRIVRPDKKSNKRINAIIGDARIDKELILNFNKGEGEAGAITTAKLKASPDAVLTFGNINTAIEGFQNEYEANANFMAKDLIFDVLNDLNLSNIRRTTRINRLKNEIDSKGGVSQAAKTKAKVGIDNLVRASYERKDNLITVKMNKDTFIEIFGDGGNRSEIPTSKVYKRVTIHRDLNPGEKEWAGKSTSIGEIRNFGTSFQRLVSVTGSSKYAKPKDSQRASIGAINDVFRGLKNELKPKKTFDKKIRQRISLFRGNNRPVKPIMAHPKYEDPMYQDVKELSQDFILPNVSLLPDNTLTIMQTNQRFIESYMAGLNHEMSRELLWREFPTDQRGSYFRQFWETEDNVFEEDADQKLDIKAMHEWKNALGRHAVQNPEGGYLVLVVRGQLLLKYPNTMVYAQEAAYNTSDPTAERELPEITTELNTKFPVFSARLEPDIFLFGFALTIDEARGERATPHVLTDAMNPGWFFVFKERPGQIKFGLDDFADELGDDTVMPDGPARTWSDLSWEHLVGSKADLETYHINFGDPITITETSSSPQWADNSADLAHILYQNPVIFARHAQEMLPDEL